MDREGVTSNDKAVQATNDDASVSKLSCVTHGYFPDDFLKFFVKKRLRRSPVIHRGYYARWAAFRKLIAQFLELQDSGRKVQIVSVGAGFDTTFFQLKDEGKAPSIYIEVDFSEVTSRKALIIASKQELSSRVGPFTVSGGGATISGQDYLLIGADLRDTAALEAEFEKHEVDWSLPTLLLSECVLIYMDPASSRTLVQWAAAKFRTSAFVVYEQIRPDDAFGQQMVQNLQIRGCPLIGLHDTPSLDSKVKRFTDHGFQTAHALDMHEIYTQHLDPSSKAKMERLEIFDEFEEWHLMQEHYCIAIGMNDPEGLLRHFGFTNSTP